MNRQKKKLRVASTRSEQRRHRARALLVEGLEDRRLLSVSPSGLEFRVNSTTFGSQVTESFYGSQTVAVDAEGDSVITWQSHGQDGSGWGIYVRRYNAAGVAQGGEFRVNTTTASSQVYSSVAMDANGDFLVSWSSYGQDGSGYGIYAQRYNAAGVAQGGEFESIQLQQVARSIPRWLWTPMGTS